MKFLLLLMMFCASFARANVYNIATISAEDTEAYVCVGKDADSRYYKGARFDPTGVVLALKTDGKIYFGNRYTVHRPDWHDSISGPVEEYATIGYDDVKVGEGFLKIGVGILEKIANEPYNFRVKYPLKNAGERSVTVEKDNVKYIHKISDKSGYGYVLKKTLRVEKNKLIVEHDLENTGARAIDSNMYSHCFFIVDNASVDESVSVKYNFNLENYTDGILADRAKIVGNEIKFLRKVVDEERVHLTSISADASAENSVSVEFGNVKAGVRVKCDMPMMKSIFWACRNSVCPEPFVKIFLKPNEKMSWKFEYEFYPIK